MKQYFFRTKNNNSTNNLSNIIDKLKTDKDINIGQYYCDLREFIPRFSDTILDELLSNISNTLVIENVEKSTIESIISTLCFLIEKTDDSNFSSIKQKIYNHPKFISSLFRRISFNDLNTLPLIEKLLHVSRAEISLFIDKFPHSLLPLIKYISVTKDSIASDIVKNIFSTSSNALKELQTDIKKLIKSLPINVGIELLQNESFREATPELDIGSWLVNSPDELSIDNLNSVFTIWPGLIDSNYCFDLFNKTRISSDRGIEEINWIRNTNEISIDIADDALQENCRLLSSTESKELTFLRLYVLYHVNPVKLSEPTIKLLYNMLNHTEYWITAAVIQIMLRWALIFKFNIQTKAFYISAAHSVSESDNKFKYLCKAFLIALSEQHPVIGQMISDDSELSFDFSFFQEIVTADFCFPGFEDYRARLSEIELINSSDYIKTLGFIVDSLGLE